MRLKQFIKLFIPPIYYKVRKKIFSRKKNSNIYPLTMQEYHGDKLIIIGNGPSMNRTIENNLETLQNTECLMVNFAANTSAFEQIKPCLYLLVDPTFYFVPSYVKDKIEKLYNAILQKVTWSMTIVMPKCAQGSYLVNKFKENTNLNVLFYEDSGVLSHRISQFEAWDKNLISPPSQTVLNTAVWLSIYWGYNETYLVGADTSWHTELKMDQQTNELYTIDTHFYNNKIVLGDLYDEHNKRPINTKLHEELFAEATALREYCELRKYADWKGVKVYNASEYSWIDAFERKKLD